MHKKIGIYGGAFNPVHNGHLRVAEAATLHLGLDTLLWVPTGQAWYKAGQLALPKDRVAMLELAFESVAPTLTSTWRIDASELERDGASYTVDTLELLQQKYNAKEWYLIIGADQLSKFTTWKRWRDIIKHCKLAVVNRDVSGLDTACSLDFDLKWIDIPFEQVHVSSSHIKELLKHLKDNRSTKELQNSLPRGVFAYIQEHRLYKE